MKKTTKQKSKKDEVDIEEMFFERDISHVLDENMERYSEEVLLRRALPDIRDGLKPVHRRIMYTLYNRKTMSKAPYDKVASIVGDCMGRFHPHGDSSISGALVAMSQDWTQRVPLISIEGNNGSIDGDPAAAPRYIEARGTTAAETLFEGIELDGVVPFALNYKEEEKEPVVLPARWPVLLSNGASGIAIGVKTSIPPHNVAELLKAAIYVNKNEGATLKKLMSFVPAPDFPTGGVIVKDSGIEKMYETGFGKTVIRGKVRKEKNKIVITEIPYGCTKSQLLLSIAEAVEKAKIDSQFVSIEDKSSGDLDIEVDINLRRGVDVDVIEQFLFNKTLLQSAFHANMYCVEDSRPKSVGLKEYLTSFVMFRRECIYNEAKAKIAKAKPRLHICEGMLKMSEFPDEVIAEIKRSSGRADAIARLEKVFGFSNAQSVAIATMQLYKISRQDVQKIEDEKKALEALIADNEKIIGSDKELIEATNTELKETLKDFAKDARRSQIVDESEIDEVEVVATVLKKPEPATVTVGATSAQRMSKQMYDNGKDKAAVRTVAALETMTTDALVLFTRHGLAMQRSVEDLPHVSVRNVVDPLSKTVKTFTAKDDIIAATTFPMEWALTDEDKLKDIAVLTATKLGQVKKSDLLSVLLSFKQKGYMTRTRAYNGLKLDGDEIIFLAIVEADKVKDVSLSLKRRSGGRVTKVDFNALNAQGASGSGTNAMKMNKAGDFAVVTATNADKLATSVFIAE